MYKPYAADKKAKRIREREGGLMALHSVSLNWS
jgi:hypothetical protein